MTGLERELDDWREGRGDETAYDGLAIEFLESPAGQAEVAATMPTEAPKDAP